MPPPTVTVSSCLSGRAAKFIKNTDKTAARPVSAIEAEGRVLLLLRLCETLAALANAIAVRGIAGSLRMLHHTLRHLPHAV